MTIPLGATSQTLQGNTAGLANLQATAAQDPKAAVREVAKQFEALFMQQLLKSMRGASQGQGLLDNEGSQLGAEMLDQQYAAQLTGRPGGIAEMIARQLEWQLGVRTDALVKSNASSSPNPNPNPNPEGAAPRTGRVGAAASSFVDRHQVHAQAAEAATGIPAAFILGQAAHESAWGQREIMQSDGQTSHNVFGIKAGPGWSGRVTEVTTTEYAQGKAQKVTARFRAYDSYAQAFTDYAQLLKNNPRYGQVLGQGHTPETFAQSLQKAGYATDPDYAKKLSQVINTTLRLQRGTA